MKLVVDTNILFSFFKKESFTRQIILLNQSLELISPEHSLEELKKYSKELLLKSKITKPELEEIVLSLKSKIKFMSLNKYKKELKNAISLAKDWSKKDTQEFIEDIDFFALALKENSAIWSQDKLFKKQSKIPVFNTKDMANIGFSIFKEI